MHNMAMYDFDKVVERRGSDSYKWDQLKERFGRDDLLGLWVADMDWETPPFIVDALRRRLEHPVFGYTFEPVDYWPTVAQWIETHHGWHVDIEWLKFIPGIVKGIAMAVNVFVKPDEKIIIQPPVYHPFRLVPEGNGREVVENPLILNADGSYRMDFEQLESIADEHCKMLILSNPHNPAGIVWDKDTLMRLAHFCYERGIVVISDEIHCDMTLWGSKHVPFATVSDEAAHCSITFAAPSKTFNIAGIVSSYAVVPDETLRQRFYSWLEANEMSQPTLFAPIATLAAYKEGEQWRCEMLRYVEENIRFVEDYCREHLPMIKPLRPQASFLVWLDCRDMKMSQSALVDLFVNKARLALNDGTIFGKQGEGFMRLNVGCPRSVLREAFDRLSKSIR